MKTKLHTLFAMLIAVLFLGTTTLMAQTEVVVNNNGDFSNATVGADSTDHWEFTGTDYATFEIVEDPDDNSNNLLQVTITDTAANAWTVQAIQNLELSGGNQYIASMRVRTTAGDSANAVVQLDGGEGAQLWGRQITSDWSVISSDEFMAMSTASRNFAIHLSHGDNPIGQVIQIDYLEILQTEEGETPEIEPEGDEIETPHLVSEWGFIGGRNGGSWEILNDGDTPDGEGHMAGESFPTAWATLRGGFGGLATATEEEAVVVTGQVEIIGDDVNAWSALRYGLFYNGDAGELSNQYEPNAAYDGEGTSFGYMFSPIFGTAGPTGSNMGRGNGTQWYINGTSWISTGGEAYPFGGVVEQAPFLAELYEGMYDFGFSVQPQADGTNEVRWYLHNIDHENNPDNWYWFGGTAIDPEQVTTSFNGVIFGLIDNQQNDLTGLSTYNVTVEKGDPITVPDAPFVPFYVSEWGLIGDRTGGDGNWTHTPGQFVGNTEISGDALTDWAAVRGNFGLPVVPEEENAINVTGKVTFEDGGFDGWASLRYALYYTESAGSLDSTDTHGWVWDGDETGSYGYLFLPPSAESDPVNWQGIGETGNVGAVVNRPWLSTNGDNDYVLGEFDLEPFDAFAGSGTYEFGISVLPLGDGTQRVRFALASEDRSYIFQDEVVDDHDPLVTTQFNSIAFGINNPTTTAMLLEDVYVNMGAEIDFYAQDTSADEQISGIPLKFALSQNYPNPFNPTTNIAFDLPQNSDVTLHVYNMLGQRVMTLVNGTMQAGTHSVTFDASRLASGMYIYRLQAGEFVSTKKMMLIK